LATSGHCEKVLVSARIAKKKVVSVIFRRGDPKKRLILAGMGFFFGSPRLFFFL